MTAIDTIEKITASEKSTIDVDALEQKCYDAINDDLNTPIAIAHLFDGVKMINSIYAKKESISTSDLEKLKLLFNTFVFDILGFKKQETQASSKDLSNELMDFILEIRQNAKEQKDWATADKIRDRMKAIGIEIKDGKDGAEWSLNN
jgi:cysteinyl-tRNA synthetase